MSMCPVDGAGYSLGNAPGHHADALGKTWGFPHKSGQKTRFRGPQRSIRLWINIRLANQYRAPVPELFRISTVCLGNICRSPMAEVILRDRLTTAGLADTVIVDSGGTGDWHVGYPMDQRAHAELLAAGYEVSGHMARQVNPTWLTEVDLALVMDIANFTDAKQLAADANIRMFRSFDPLLAHLDEPHPDLEVPDPYYGGDEGFTSVREMLERAADGLITQLRARP